jgi:hypothetical protein
MVEESAVYHNLWEQKEAWSGGAQQLPCHRAASIHAYLQEAFCGTSPLYCSLPARPGPGVLRVQSHN